MQCSMSFHRGPIAAKVLSGDQGSHWLDFNQPSSGTITLFGSREELTELVKSLAFDLDMLCSPVPLPPEEVLTREPAIPY